MADQPNFPKKVTRNIFFIRLGRRAYFRVILQQNNIKTKGFNSKF